MIISQLLNTLATMDMYTHPKLVSSDARNTSKNKYMLQKHVTYVSRYSEAVNVQVIFPAADR